jgi:hypothetical protein
MASNHSREVECAAALHDLAGEVPAAGLGPSTGDDPCTARVRSGH